MTQPHKLSAQDVARFWAKVDTSGECWLWAAGRYPAGYGSFWLNNKSVGAHRISWKLAYGAIPNGLFVCHKCDNPRCVNPMHLFVGTLRDNNRDSLHKGRRNKGINRPMHKLGECDVLRIRSTYRQSASPSYRQLSRSYGVTPNTIGEIIRRETWKHL